ncbi:glycosyltransferase family 2 protein [Thermoclostridium caenicola]|uniref:Glycosyltransferase involved in cell wall bisynthesis n=1 Tax=Thermoclostridium caenicola TaxID=659425 RepID=A0A1M6IY30_9FIRM|nr:glycosyltransferase family 2 protein [Thermoclostridium caenicola]SHJ39317.1 Glycosyltransferase involved in cell wall bisynthesis [Thermoclostridium caenicola]
MGKRLTVFTPTYNRAKLLPNLYKSLIAQNSKEFVWLIVDDGSTDNTEEVVQSFIDDALIEIKYYKQENQGKHVAHNLAVQEADSELFVCVDSDDSLTSNAVEEILMIWDNTPKSSDICGIIGPRSNSRVDKWPKNILYGTLSDLYERYKFSGDTIIAFRTEIIKQYMFPVFKGEKFLQENIIYLQIDKHFRYIYTDKILYIGQYLEDGLSMNIMRIMLKSPKGTALFFIQKASMARNVIDRFKAYACYLAIEGDKEFLRDYKIDIITKTIGTLLKNRYKRIFKEYMGDMV